MFTVSALASYKILKYMGKRTPPGTWNCSNTTLHIAGGEREKSLPCEKYQTSTQKLFSVCSLLLSQPVNTEQEGWDEKYHLSLSLSLSLCLCLALTTIESQYIFISRRPWDLLILLQSTCRPKRGLFFWQTAKVDFVRNLLRLLAEFPPPAPNLQSNIRLEKLDRRWLTFSVQK